jgi:nicotinate-nucleotide--dimethylbenzimidazole phosphoribosyltransferase
MIPEINLSNLDDVRSLLSQLPDFDQKSAEKVKMREPTLTKPPGSLGRLEELSLWLSSWQGTHPPQMENPHVLVFSGSHGITEEGVSAYPAEVTAQMLENFHAGGAAVNQLSQAFGATLHAIDINVANPTKSFIREPAMSVSKFVDAFERGLAAVDPAFDVVCIGEMGIGNTTVAAAICHTLNGGDAAHWVGPGTGVAGTAMEKKCHVVAMAHKLYSKPSIDGIEALRSIGGGELVAMAGAIIGARIKGVPVVLDGYVSGAAAAALFAVAPTSLDHCIAGHVSAEPGHKLLLDKLGLEPLLDLNMRLGEASGAAVALGILKAAVACHAGMATFEAAEVLDKSDGV